MTLTSSARPPLQIASRLAVVEDDRELREQILVPAFQAAGFDTAGFATALDLYREWTRSPFGLVLLDIGLPDEDGVEIVRHLRTLAASIGIVIYSGHSRGSDRMRALRAGADVYLVKPVDVDEIVETMRNFTRRMSAAGGDAAGKHGWTLSHRGWRLVLPSGNALPLSRSEREVMLALAECTGTPVSREVLANRLTCDSEGFDPHRLEMLVYRLRRKCEAAGHPLALTTVRGAGYRLDW